MTFDALFTERRIPFRKKGPTQLQVCCPFCGDKRYRMGVNTAANQFNCFNCNRHGSLWKLARALDGNVDITRTAYAAVRTAEVDLPAEYEPLGCIMADDDYAFGSQVKYLNKRGFGTDDIKRYHIGGCISGRFAGRVIFPVFDGATLYAFTGRSIGHGEPKYLNNTGGTRALWGDLRQRATATEVMIVSEGIIKAHAISKVTSWPSVSSLGNFLTEFQADQLVAYGWPEVLIFPDPYSRPSVQGIVKSYETCIDRNIRLYRPQEFPKMQADDYAPIDLHRAIGPFKLVDNIDIMQLRYQLGNI